MLQKVAHLIGDSLRPGDTVARYGGEEFAAILPDMSGSAAATVAERIRSSIAGHTFVSPEGNLAVTIRIGIAEIEIRSIVTQCIEALRLERSHTIRIQLVGYCFFWIRSNQ